jgi:hypothetical protein
MSTHGCFASFLSHTRLIPSDDGAPEPAAPVDDGGYYYYPAGEYYYYEEPSDDQE